jgi:mono/diheme cytochrome c family protein
MIFSLISGSFCSVLADDDYYQRRHRYRGGSQWRADDNEPHDHDTNLKTVTNQTYKETCGACHFAYQPGLLPSGSWAMILGHLEHHFGEALSIDTESKRTIGKYLMDNAAERSSAKRSVKIMKSLRGQTPSRITEIPYIVHKHKDIAPEVFNRKAVGSFSNCSACHRTAEQGVYDDDNTVIPK